MAPTVYLVAGASRGIGLAVVTQLAARDNTIVFAGARNPAGATGLQELVGKHPGKVHVVKLAAADAGDNEAAVAEIKKVAGRLDIVLFNAGKGDHYAPATEVDLDNALEHFHTNAIGPLALFQATWPLLKASTETPKFFITSSALGSLHLAPQWPWPTLVYGASKVAANYIAAKLWYEYPGLISIPIHPGVVTTPVADELGAIAPSFKDLPHLTPEESASGIIKIIDNAKRDENGPKLTNYDGTTLPW